MKNSYTRQRQGRDFRAPDDAKKEHEKESALARLKEWQAFAEQANTPIDGSEPDGIHPEKER